MEMLNRINGMIYIFYILTYPTWVMLHHKSNLWYNFFHFKPFSLAYWVKSTLKSMHTEHVDISLNRLVTSGSDIQQRYYNYHNNYHYYYHYCVIIQHLTLQVDQGVLIMMKLVICYLLKPYNTRMIYWESPEGATAIPHCAA